jgi:hypothetical protein
MEEYMKHMTVVLLAVLLCLTSRCGGSPEKKRVRVATDDELYVLLQQSVQRYQGVKDFPTTYDTNVEIHQVTGGVFDAEVLIKKRSEDLSVALTKFARSLSSQTWQVSSAKGVCKFYGDPGYFLTNSDYNLSVEYSAWRDPNTEERLLLQLYLTQIASGSLPSLGGFTRVITPQSITLQDVHAAGKNRYQDIFHAQSEEEVRTMIGRGWQQGFSFAVYGYPSIGAQLLSGQSSQ